ncbi:MAG TPA: hypothetical protein VFC99_05760 [Acidimicrobiia bacterium]|nr:hypothetical protein [Acidimicrobiia bacterium]
MATSPPAAAPEVTFGICVEQGCDQPVMEPGGGFGRGVRCEQHWKERRDAGRARAREEGGTQRKAPRARGRPARDTAPRAPRPSPLVGRIESALATIGMAVYVFNAADGQAVLEGAHELAVALDQLARENPTVRRVLERALATGAWGAVLVAGAKIAIPIAANHGLDPLARIVPAPSPPMPPGGSASAPEPFDTRPAPGGVVPEYASPI